MKDVKTIIFDYDGTLHDSAKIYVEAFRQVYREMVSAKDAPEREFQDEEITKWLGYSVQDMWDSFMPEFSQEKKMFYAGEVGRFMTEKIRNKEAVLYDGALETLQYLKDKGYHLLYLSNCGRAYMEIHAESFGLKNYFEHMYCSGDYDQKPKYEIFNVIKEEYPSEWSVTVSTIWKWPDIIKCIQPAVLMVLAQKKKSRLRILYWKISGICRNYSKSEF